MLLLRAVCPDQLELLSLGLGLQAPRPTEEVAEQHQPRVTTIITPRTTVAQQTFHQTELIQPPDLPATHGMATKREHLSKSVKKSTTAMRMIRQTPASSQSVQATPEIRRKC